MSARSHFIFRVIAAALPLAISACSLGGSRGLAPPRPRSMQPRSYQESLTQGQFKRLTAATVLSMCARAFSELHRTASRARKAARSMPATIFRESIRARTALPTIARWLNSHAHAPRTLAPIGGSNARTLDRRQGNLARKFDMRRAGAYSEHRRLLGTEAACRNGETQSPRFT